MKYRLRIINFILLFSFLLPLFQLAPAAAADEQGKLVTGYVYDDMHTPSEGFAAVQKDGRWGYIDNTGAEVTEFIYLAACRFSGGLAAVMDDSGLWGFINTRGKPVSSFKFASPGANGTYDPDWGFSEGLCPVLDAESKKVGYIDTGFQTVIECRYDKAAPFSEGRAAVGTLSDKNQLHIGYIDTHGSRINQSSYFSLLPFSGGLCPVVTENGYGVIDLNGSMVVDDEWDRIYNSSGVLTLKSVEGDNVVCAISSASTKLFSDQLWEDIGEYSEGLIPVKFKGLWGFVDISGMLVIDAEYDSATAFSSGCSLVSLNGSSIYINKNGSKIGEADFVSAFKDNCAIIREEGSVRLLFTNGRSSALFTDASLLSGGLASVSGSAGGEAKFALYHDMLTPLSDPYYPGASTWALESLRSAEKLGLLNPLGYYPDYSSEITREQFCQLVVSAYTSLGGSFDSTITNPFTDTNNISVIRAYGAGIVKGRTATAFAPSEPVTREEICVMLDRLCDAVLFSPALSKNQSFTDSSAISTWAASSVTRMSRSGIISGFENGSFRPQGYTTVEQAVIMFVRLLSAEGTMIRR